MLLVRNAHHAAIRDRLPRHQAGRPESGKSVNIHSDVSAQNKNKVVNSSLRFILFVGLGVVLSQCRTVLYDADPEGDLRRTTRLWKILGTSVENRPIFFYERGEVDSTILILGGTHGDEPVTSQVVARFAEVISRLSPDSLKYKIVIIPVLNPDGLAKRQRKNARGVDINRNFPTRDWKSEAARERYHPGPFPASEPETKIVLDLLVRHNPRIIISVHAPLFMINYDGPAKEIAERMAAVNGYRVSDSIGYGTPGSFGTYAGVERNIPIITLELPDEMIEEVWEANRDALLELLR